MPKEFDLSIRLVDFANDCIEIAESLPKTFAATHMGNQLTRSCSSTAIHYGEARAAESSADFIHKMKVCLKELRETQQTLRLIKLKKWHPESKMTAVLNENDELIAIFVSSINTARKNSKPTPS